MCGVCVVCSGSDDDIGRVGGRSGCGHTMCRECAEKWFAIDSRCPVCRGDVVTVTFEDAATLRVGGRRRQPVWYDSGDTTDTESDTSSDDDNDDDSSYTDSDESEDDDSGPVSDKALKEREQTEIATCTACGQDDHPDRLLLCDAPDCYNAVHTFCLVPPLRRVPARDWFCPDCKT